MLASPSIADSVVEPLLQAEEGAVVTGQPCTSCNLDTFSTSTYSARPAKIQFTLDVLVMTRDDAEDNPLLFDALTAEPLLRPDQLTSGAEPGIRVGVIFFDEQGGRDLEFSYLGIDRFGEPKSRQSNNGIIFPFFSGVPAVPQNQYTVAYFSELDSGEVNVRQRLGERVSVLAGLRLLELNERFNVESGGGAFRSDIDNDLYGFQLGGDIHLANVRRSLVFATAKAGVYYNNADISATATNPATGGIIQFIDDEDEVAFVGDLTVGILVPMGPQADLRIGYEGLFLDGVGIAPDQSDNFSIFTGAGTIDQTTLIYHGGFIGFDLFW